MSVETIGDRSEIGDCLYVGSVGSSAKLGVKHHHQNIVIVERKLFRIGISMSIKILMVMMTEVMTMMTTKTMLHSF